MNYKVALREQSLGAFFVASVWDNPVLDRQPKAEQTPPKHYNTTILEFQSQM